MDEPELPPALTPGEWRTVLSLETDCDALDAVTFLEIVLGPNPCPHAAAAALLHDRPFGFTHEMAAALRLLLARAEGRAPAEADDELRRALEAAGQLEARLTALLPTEGGAG